jgi:hypothetical protein
MVHDIRSHQNTIFSPLPEPLTDDLADSPKKNTRKSMMLPLDFTPGTWDVICQRGKVCNDHSKFSMTTPASN